MNLEEAILKRRDTRHFLKDEVPEEILKEAIEAASHAPSVGLSEPWRFIIIKEEAVKQKIKLLFEESSNIASTQINNEEQKNKYNNLKLEGVLEAPIGMVVFCDYSSANNFTIGTVTQKREMLLCSTACAIQNMWLYLTSKGYGMGWVSIIDFDKLKILFDVPEDWFPLGYFCIGKPSTNYDGKPMLVKEGWKEKNNINSTTNF